jgi:hypothetical protein
MIILFFSVPRLHCTFIYQSNLDVVKEISQGLMCWQIYAITFFLLYSDSEDDVHLQGLNVRKNCLSWSWSYGSWIYNYLCNQCLSPRTLWVRTLLRRGVLDTTLCDKVCQWLAAGQWFSPGTAVSSTNKTDRQDITEILLKMALNTITITHNQKKGEWYQYYLSCLICWLK